MVRPDEIPVLVFRALRTMDVKVSSQMFERLLERARRVILPS